MPTLYAFSPAVLRKKKTSTITIRLFPHKHDVVMERVGELDHIAQKSNVNTRLICNWFRESPTQQIPHELHPSGIEREDRWARKGWYQPLYPSVADRRHVPAGLRAEYWFLERLRAAGIRAEHATPFEDEMLGIDLWIPHFILGAWTWLPFDVTLKDIYQEFEGEPSKFTQTRARSVLPFRLTDELLDFPDLELSQYVVHKTRERLREYADVELIKRTVALTLEQSKQIPAALCPA